MSSPTAGHNCSTAWSGRKWFATSFRISFSSDMDGWNRCGCEAAMARGKDCCKHEVRASAEAEGAKKFKKKWWRGKK
jgi:hypothetical protein